MKTVLIRLTILFVATSSPILSLANEAQGDSTQSESLFNLEEFRKDHDQYEQFKIVKANGKIDEGRKRILSACAESTGDEATDCSCFSKELEKISDEEFYYESVIAFKQYQKEVEASKVSQQKYKEVAEKHSKRKGMGPNLFEKCKK